MSVAMEDWPRRHRISVDEYHRMAESGLFAPDARVELIDGEIIDMPPIGSPHAGTVDADYQEASVTERPGTQDIGALPGISIDLSSIF